MHLPMWNDLAWLWSRTLHQEKVRCFGPRLAHRQMRMYWGTDVSVHDKEAALYFFLVLCNRNFKASIQCCCESLAEITKKKMFLYSARWFFGQYLKYRRSTDSSHWPKWVKVSLYLKIDVQAIPLGDMHRNMNASHWLPASPCGEKRPNLYHF